jgi:6-phosphogluconolactonase
MLLTIQNKAGVYHTLNLFNSVDEVLTSLAEFIVRQAAEAIAVNDRFSLVLSGGSSPKKLYELLSSASWKNRIEWEKVYFFFGDERNVPQDDPESNFLMAQKALFDPLEIDPTHIFAVDTALVPEKAALQYTRDIAEFFGKEEWRFDLVLLGLGDDAHTASLFPFTTVLKEKEAAVRSVFLPEKKVFRISMTAPLINNAHRIAFLVFGESKANAIEHILKDELDTDKYPAQLIAPSNSEIDWFLDKKAGGNYFSR